MRSVGALVLVAAAAADDSLYAWESPAATYYDETALPGDASSCCGSQLIGDPAYVVVSQI